MGLQRIDNAQDCIGRRQSFRIIEYKDNGRNIILSSRLLQEEQRKKEQEALKDTLHEGMIVTGKVVSLKAYGAFLDIGGFQGLLPISAIGWERVEHIEDHLSVGQELEVVISSFDREKNRLSFSLKKMLSDPWNDVATKYPIGSMHMAKILRVMNYGAFAALEPGVDGLIHISKLGGGRRVTHPNDTVKPGDLIQVRIDAVDGVQKRISLSLPSDDVVTQEGVSKQTVTEDDFRQYTGGEASLGSLGDILNSGIKRQKPERKQKNGKH